jgi:hypothetical protein
MCVCVCVCVYLTATGMTPGGSSTSHIYTQTIHIIQRKENLGSVGRAPSLRVNRASQYTSIVKPT